MAYMRKRIYAGFKRKRAGYASRPFKRRRFVRRSRRAGGRSSTYGNKSDTYSGFRFKARKWSRRRWNRTLWNSTQQKSHYRSAAAWVDSITTPAAATLGQITIYQAMDNGARFWTAGGGGFDVDGGTLPVFNDDIILRGGRLQITITFADATVSIGDHLKVRVYLVKGAKNVNLSNFNSAARSAAWDLSMFPEFVDVVGRIKLSRSFELGENQGAARTIEYRVPIEKIDSEAYNTLSSGRYFWVVQVHNPCNANATSANLHFCHNLSFSGDSVGTT